MIKLDRKGYMTVEIIIASVIAFSIAFFLMEITMKLVDITDNEYVNTNFMTDKALVMNNIRRDLESDIKKYGQIDSINCNDNYCNISFENSSNDSETRNIVIDNDNSTIEYTDNENIIYSKILDSGMNNMSLNGDLSDEYVYFQIKCDNIFDNNSYDINIVVYNR